ncbi:AI-2E family transporter [Azomonas macrocytogenes]|uniref:Putative PurR-regulated permease PerM n=1 Tax=Azomonas macrocytogenes TaxID=69962 RepID=A0A839T3T9_AZOMA|nr:AI-2E family transporter [Azomonas macrocytogenes]MBB3103669.1 putative PurR-regulated permease PerM [Azomonas macrocytogenes]
MAHSKTEQRFFLALLIFVSIAFVWILLPYYGAVFWAVILAIIFAPMQRRLQRSYPGRDNLTAMTTLVACLLLAVLPMSIITTMLVQQASDVYLAIQDGQVDFDKYLHNFKSMLPDVLEKQLNTSGYGTFENIRKRLAEGALHISQVMATQAYSFGQGTFDFVVSFFIMVYILFFFIRDGRDLVVRMYTSVPLNNEQKRRLFSKFTRVVRATVKGNIVIAATQGALGGIIFAILDVPGAFLWGVVMAFLSLLPAVGAGIVWVPVALFFFMSGNLLKAVVLTAYGILVIGLVDNVLRPILVGKDTKMPDYLVLISTLGGLAVFGLNGFVIGPLIAALFISAWALFGDIDLTPEEEAANKLKEKEKEEQAQKQQA